MDIIIINFNSYWLLEQQVMHWHTFMKGDFNLILVDNTPDHLYKPFEYQGKLIPRVPGTYAGQFDGESSGLAYEYAISLCNSSFIGMTDPDHFWLDPLIMMKAQIFHHTGASRCTGDAGFYRDFQSIFDVANPDHRGELAPVLWGQFMDLDLAKSESWICSAPGVGQITGWRVREKIIDQNIPCVVFPGFYKEEPGEDPDICYFGDNKDKPLAVHFLKGSGGRQHVMESRVPPVLAREKAKW